MPDKSFKIGEEVFDIPENEVGGFLKDNPDATEVVSYVIEKDTFDVPINEANDFLQQNPNAKELKKKDQLEVSLPGLGKAWLPVQQDSNPISEGVSNPFKSFPVIGKFLDQKLPSDLSTSESVDIKSELPKSNIDGSAGVMPVGGGNPAYEFADNRNNKDEDVLRRSVLKQESAKLNEQGKLAKQDFEVSQKNYYDLKQVVDSYEDIATNPMYEGSAYKEEAMSVLNNLAPAYQAAAAKSNQDASVINGFVETLAAKNDELDAIAERQSSYVQGAAGAINTGVADMFDSFSGINKFADKYLFGGMFTDENVDDGYAKVANAIRDGSASLEKMPDNLAGDVLGGIAGTLPLIGQTILAPESLGPKLSSTLAFNHFGKTYKETGDVLESVASGVGGWTEGYFMHEIGMGSGKAGELLGKKTGSDVLGKTTGAILSSFGFGGYDFANQYLANFNKPESEQKEIDWRQVASSAGMGLGMSLPSLLHAKAVSDFMDVDINAAKQSLLIERPLSDIRNSAIEMMEEAPTMRPEEKKNTILLSQGLQRMANVRFVAERLTLDPEYKTAIIKDIKNSETLTPEQKQQQVDKINQFVEETSPIAAEKETINSEISELQEAIEQNNTNTEIGETERKLNNKTLEEKISTKESEMESLIANDLKTKQEFLEKRREELKQKLNGKESKKSSQEKGSENEVLGTPETEGVKEVATTAEPITSTGETKRVTPESKPVENKKPTTVLEAQQMLQKKQLTQAEYNDVVEPLRKAENKKAKLDSIESYREKLKKAVAPEHTRGTKKQGFFDTDKAIDITIDALKKSYELYDDAKIAIENAIKEIKNSDWYKENLGKLFTEKDFDTEFKEYFGEESYRKTQEQKQIEKETGVKKESKTIITDEYTLLKKRLKDQEQGAKYGEKEAKEKAKEKALEIDELRSSAKDLVKNKFKDGELGDLTDGQVNRLLEKMSDIKTEKGLDRFIDYVEKISNKDVVEKDANVDPEIVKEEVKIAKSELEQDYRNLEKVLFGSETPKEYVSGNSPLTLRTGRMQDATLGKLKKYVGDGIDRAVERHLQSQNPYLRNFGQVLNNVLRLGITPERMKAYSKYTGDKQRAIGDAARANETLKKIVGNNKESLSRIHQVLDPEMYLQTRADVLAELKAEIGEVDFSKMSEADKNKQYENYIESIKELPELTYEDLTPEEKRLHDVLKQVNDITHKINFSLGKIDYGKYISGKGKYIARMYEAFEMPKDLKEVYESSSKINEGLYKERGGLTDWKLENKIDDPVYLTTKRLYTTLTNKAVSDYAEFISKEKSELVSDIERPGYTKLGKGYGELSDKYVLDSVAEDFKGFFFTTDVIQKSYDLFKAYNKFAPRQFYKKLFTIYNPGTQLGNIMGDNIFGFLVGVDPVTLNKNTYGFALKEVKDYGQTYRYLLGKGLLKSDLTREDLTGSLKNYDDLIEKASKADSPFKYLKEKAQQADGFVNKIYSSVDDLYKIGAFKSLVDKGYTPEAAIKQVENGFQNGNKIPKVYDFASKIPVVGNPFGRWGADLGRIVTNSVSTRPLQTAAFLGSLSFLSYLSSSLSGESEDEKRIRTNRPGAAKIPMPNFLGGDIPLSYKIGENELNVARFLTPLFTYNSPDDDAVSSVFNKFSPLPIEISGRTMNPSGSAAVTIAKNINDPIWTWGQLLVDSDFRGKPILDPNSTIYKQSTLTNKEKTVNAVRFLSQNYIPYFREGASVYDAATGQKDYFGRERDVPQALLRLIGVKIEKYGEEQYTKAFEGSVRSKAYKFMDNSKKASIIRKDLADGKITREVAENRMAPITQEQAKIISEINIEAQAVNNKFSNNLKEEILKDIKGYSNAVDNVGKLEVEPKKKKKWTRVE